jgi:hypothetical protein
MGFSEVAVPAELPSASIVFLARLDKRRGIR